MSILNRLLTLLSYPRGVAASLFSAAWTIFMSVIVLFLAVVVRHRPTVDFAIVNLWCRVLLFVSGVRVKGSGRENAEDSDKGFIILFNHTSLMDIPILYDYFPRSFRFGAKIELFSIPFFGKAMRSAGVLPIDRANRDKVMKVYEEASSRVQRGECFALAPEGTRSTQPKIGPFKRGPFEFAINAGIDVVPVVLFGAYDVLPPKALWMNLGTWTREVQVKIMPRISTAGMKIEQVEELQQRVRTQMLEAFGG